MNIASTTAASWFLNGIGNLQRAEIITQRQISSGFRIQDAADSPSQTTELIGLSASLSASRSYQSNLGRVQAEVTSADTALTTAVKLVESARTIALQGAGTASTASDRQNLATQAQNIQQQLVALANTTTEGRYIFGGDQDLAPPYATNAASPTGVDKLTAQTATRIIADTAGQAVYQSATASTIFDHRGGTGAPAPDNVFAAIQGLSASLQNNDPAGIASALTALEGASGWLNQQQASYGVAAQRITAAQTDVGTSITGLQTSISGIRDTDIVQAATDLAQESTAQSAAFAAQGQIPRKSLFDYLG